MRKLFIFVFGMIVGGGLVGFGFKYHLVHANDGLILVPKTQAGLGELYVDVRSWKPSDWQSHPELVRSLVAHGRSDVIGSSANGFLRDLMRKFDKAESVDDETRLE